MLDNTGITRAGFGPRAAAYLIDRLLLALALLFVKVPAAIAALFGAGGFTQRAFLFRYSALDVLCWVLICVYFILLTYFTGSTLGKKIMHLRVESADGAPLSLPAVIYRETVGRFLSGILCLGYLMTLADRDKRAFHDWLCESRVVYEGVAFKPRTPYRQSGYSVPGDARPEADPPAPTVYSVPSAVGYSIPGSSDPTPAEEVLPSAETVSAPPFPAEEPARDAEP